MTKEQYVRIMELAKGDTGDMEIFFTWLEIYPNFVDEKLAPIEIELSYLCYNIAFEAFMTGVNYLSEYE
jgi:hypothetical protein